MRSLQLVLLLTAVLLAGCKQVDGTYYPGCVAFEGDKLVLDQGNVTLDRFTDQIILDADGNEIDQFPEFPKTGRYEVDGRTLHLNFADGELQKTLHIHRSGNRILLLDAENLANWERTGKYDDCTLTLAPDDVP